MSEHRILQDLLAAFGSSGPGRIAVVASANGAVLGDSNLVQFIVPTWGNSNNVIILPNPQPQMIVVIAGAATGGKLRPKSSTTTINSVSELTVDENQMVIAICESATSWKALTIAGSGSIKFLIITTGESNSGGLAPNTSATPTELGQRTEVSIWVHSANQFQPLDIGTNNNLDHAGCDPSMHGIELELANIVASGRFGSDKIYFLQTGQGGSNIQDWDTGSSSQCWTKFVAKYAAASAALGTFTPVIFYSQGINDAVNNNYFGAAAATTDPALWKTRTVSHLAKIRALVGAQTLIVMTKFKFRFNSFNVKIDEIAAEDPYTVAIETGDVGSTQWLPDEYHWSYLGFKELTNNFVDEIFAATTTAPSVSPVAGSYSSAQTVSITGSNVRYSTNRIDPHIGTNYSSSFSATPPIAVSARTYGVKTKSSLVTIDYLLTGLPTWIPADAATTGLTLNFANLDLAHAGSAWRTCKVQNAKSTGKYYIEFQCQENGIIAYQMFGLCTPSFTLTDHLFASSGGCAVWTAGFNTGGGFTVGTGTNSYANATPVVGDLYAIAVDFDAGKMWYLKNNTVMGGSPASGTDPQFTFTANTSLHAAMSFYIDSSVWRVLSAASNQIYSPPSGFSPWG